MRKNKAKAPRILEALINACYDVHYQAAAAAQGGFMMPENSKLALDPKWMVSEPEKIPALRYYDEDFYKAECDSLWGRAWQMACRLEQIPNVGDWIEYSNLGKSVIVVRTKDGVRAYHNHCRHRGVQLAHEAHGNCEVRGFTCPFHGWRWNMNGENTFVYGQHLFSEDLLCKDDLALRQCRVELWGGCAFINFDQKAQPLRECLGAVAENLEAHGVANLRAEWWYETVLPANWKTAMEAFMEGYHVMRTHPQLQHIVPMLYNSRYGDDTQGLGAMINPRLSVRENIQAHFEHFKLLSTGMAGLVHEKEVAIVEQLLDVDLPDDPMLAVPQWFRLVHDEITRQLRQRGEDVPDLNAVWESHPISYVEFVFPNFFLLPFFSGMSSYRIRPLGPETCLFEIWSLTHHPKGQEPPPIMEPTKLPYDSLQFPPIPQQDFSNIPMQQRGLRSSGFEFMRLSKHIEGLISNYQRVIDGYLRGEPAAKLARASASLAGNFDGPILELYQENASNAAQIRSVGT